MKKYSTAFLMLLLLISLVACRNVKFNGSRTGNDKQLLMKYSVFNTTDSQYLDLHKGDIVDVEIVNDSGTLSIKLQKDNEDPIYQNDDASTDTFSLTIKESGVYQLTLTGKNAKGNVSFITRTNAN